MFFEIGFFKYWFFVEILSVVYMIFVLKYIGNIFYWLYINFRIFLEKKVIGFLIVYVLFIFFN